MMRPRPLLWLGAVCVLLGVAWGIERLVVTDKEAIRALVERTTEAVKTGDFDAVAQAFDPAYDAEGRDRDGMVEYLRTLWRRFRPLGLEVDLGEVTVEGDDASALAEISANVVGRPTRIEVTTVFRRTDAGWRIAAARPVGWPR